MPIPTRAVTPGPVARTQSEDRYARIARQMDMKQASQVLDLLEFFGSSGQPATLAEVCKRLGWPKSSAFKLLATLSARGYIYEPYGRGLYYPSPKWNVVVDAITRNEPVPPALRTLLLTLVELTGETAVLASISGLDAFFVDAIEPEKPVRYTAKVGKTVPLYATAIGRALLAQLPSADRKTLLAKTSFERFTKATLTSSRAIEAEIAKGARRGYFLGQGELNDDLGGVAVPLNVPGRPLAVMVAGPFYRIAPRYSDVVRTMMKQMSQLEDRLAATGQSTAEQSGG